MNTLRDAAQQALEALETLAHTKAPSVYNSARDALRAALAEPQPEPVAWMVYTEDGASAYVTDNPNDLVGAYRALPLYTTPPQLQPLTKEKIDDCWLQSGGMALDFARALEKAHGIGGAT